MSCGDCGRLSEDYNLSPGDKLLSRFIKGLWKARLNVQVAGEIGREVNSEELEKARSDIQRLKKMAEGVLEPYRKEDPSQKVFEEKLRRI